MRSKEMRNLSEKYNVKLSFTALYFPQADPTERVNRIIKTMLSSYVKDNQRTFIACAIGTAKHEVKGSTPYVINFGREHIINGSFHNDRISEETELLNVEPRQQGFRELLYEEVRNRIKQARRKNEKYYNLRRRPVQYQVGDRVWKRNKVQSNALNYFNAKLAPKFIGPFLIRRQMGSCTYELGVCHIFKITRNT